MVLPQSVVDGAPGSYIIPGISLPGVWLELQSSERLRSFQGLRSSVDITKASNEETEFRNSLLSISYPLGQLVLLDGWADCMEWQADTFAITKTN